MLRLQAVFVLGEGSVLPCLESELSERALAGRAVITFTDRLSGHVSSVGPMGLQTLAGP